MATRFRFLLTILFAIFVDTSLHSTSHTATLSNLRLHFVSCVCKIYITSQFEILNDSYQQFFDQFSRLLNPIKRYSGWWANDFGSVICSQHQTLKYIIPLFQISHYFKICCATRTQLISTNIKDVVGFQSRCIFSLVKEQQQQLNLPFTPNGSLRIKS